jgi:hypothetical protein
MEIEVNGGIIEPGDMIVVGGPYGFNIGFYRGKGYNSIQYYDIHGLSYGLEKKLKKYPWSVSRMSGTYKNQRVMKYSPELITEPEKLKVLQQAIEFIRETNILPIKY